MVTPVKRLHKSVQDNKKPSKPTAQDMHQGSLSTTEAPAMNPTNAADSFHHGTTHHGTGYATPDSPSENGAGGAYSPTNSIQNDGDKEIPREIPQPDSPQQTPVIDNPRM